MPVINIKNLNKKFGANEVLRDINLTVDKGEVVAIIGPSGSGKSTLLRCMNLLDVPSKGKVIFEDNELTQHNVQLDNLRQKMGMVFQNFNLFPHKKVIENVMLAPLLLHKDSKDQLKEKALYLLEKVGLKDKADSYPNQLSGGQKQRLSIARIFLNNPPILILDEATSALDLESESIIQEALDVLSKDRTTLIVAHRLSTITHADKIVVIENGHIVETGTHRELIAKQGAYEHLYSIQNL